MYMTPRERDQSRSPAPRSTADEINVVNIVIAKNFNFVDDDIQVQALQVSLLSTTMIRELTIFAANANPKVSHGTRIVKCAHRFPFLTTGGARD